MVSVLKFTVAERSGKSFLKNSYYTHPFKLAPVGEDPADPTLYLMIRSSSPGVLDQDSYAVEINLKPNCRLNLQTQSYQRVFRMEKGASQNMVVNLGPDSSFCFISHPLVPHENAIFQSRTTINMASGSTLIWGEVITCGRKLSGEAFRFTFLRTVLQVYRHEKLVFKDHLLLCPYKHRLKGIGQFENFTHQANLVYLPPSLNPDLINDLNEYFLKRSELAVGVTEIAANGILIRILGNRAEQLFACLQELSFILQKTAVEPNVLLSALK